MLVQQLAEALESVLARETCQTSQLRTSRSAGPAGGPGLVGPAGGPGLVGPRAGSRRFGSVGSGVTSPNSSIASPMPGGNGGGEFPKWAVAETSATAGGGGRTPGYWGGGGEGAMWLEAPASRPGRTWEAAGWAMGRTDVEIVQGVLVCSLSPFIFILFSWHASCFSRVALLKYPPVE